VNPKTAVTWNKFANYLKTNVSHELSNMVMMIPAKIPGTKLQGRDPLQNPTFDPPMMKVNDLNR